MLLSNPIGWWANFQWDAIGCFSLFPIGIPIRIFRKGRFMCFAFLLRLMCFAFLLKLSGLLSCLSWCALLPVKARVLCLSVVIIRLMCFAFLLKLTGLLSCLSWCALLPVKVHVLCLSVVIKAHVFCFPVVKAHFVIPVPLCNKIVPLCNTHPTL